MEQPKAEPHPEGDQPQAEETPQQSESAPEPEEQKGSKLGITLLPHPTPLNPP